MNLCKWQGFSVTFIWTNYLMSIGTCFEFGIAWYARFVWRWKTRFYIFLKSFKIRINANWNLFSLTLKAPFTPSTGNIVLTGWWCKQNCLWLFNTFWEKKILTTGENITKLILIKSMKIDFQQIHFYRIIEIEIMYTGKIDLFHRNK